jgi:MOSC domain-containing protein YiiM
MKVKAVCISEKKGTVKMNIGSCEVTATGLKGDAHAGDWHRQVSLLAEESIEKMRKLGLDISYGAFAENITTEGIILYQIPIGTRIKINDVELEVTQIGKECHSGCAIQKTTGKCVMPKEGIFTKVIHTGTIHTDDPISIIKK